MRGAGLVDRPDTVGSNEPPLHRFSKDELPNHFTSFQAPMRFGRLRQRNTSAMTGLTVPAR